MTVQEWIESNTSKEVHCIAQVIQRADGAVAQTILGKRVVTTLGFGDTPEEAVAMAVKNTDGKGYPFNW